MSALIHDVETAVREALQESGIDVSRLLFARDGDEVVVTGDLNSAAEREKAIDAAARLARRSQVRCALTVSLVYEAAEDIVYEAGVESFPASDPPCWMSGAGRT